MREDLVCLDALLREGPLCAFGRLLVVGWEDCAVRRVGLGSWMLLVDDGMGG